MDISTLSRELNMSVKELRTKMRSAGFRISPRARKVNNNVAQEIKRKLLEREEQAQKREEREEQATTTSPKKIIIPSVLTVREFAESLQQPVNEVIKKLIENGVMATINEEIDVETAIIIGEEFGTEVKVEDKGGEGKKLSTGFVAEILENEDKKDLKLRPPIVAVMGHVDHGKTTLLDTLRKTNVAGGESGAITQHIGAYMIEHKGKPITFLDTPGHEAFAAMRARGANVTDLIVLVVAADDSVKPQTVEVINRAKLTKTPLIVAINKIDKPDANLEKVKGDLAQLGVTIEEWGGDVPVVPISAKKGENLDKLLEIILLTSEVTEFKANPAGQVVGAVIESHLSRGQGPVATMIVQNGTLTNGDAVVVGATYGKIRTMEDAAQKRLKKAGPSTPVKVSGLSDVPEVGDIFRATETLEEAKQIALENKRADRVKRLRSKAALQTKPGEQELNLIIRADVRGSLEAILEALSQLENEDVKLNIVDQGVGEIKESDVQHAESTGSAVLGFHVRPSAAAAKLAQQKGVIIDTYNVIYELLEDVTQALLKLMPVEVTETVVGRAKIKAVFMTDKKAMIVGGEVIEGKLIDKKKFRIIREKEEVGSGKIEELQQNKVDVSEVGKGNEFGIKANVDTKIEEGDILEVIDEEVKKKELK